MSRSPNRAKAFAPDPDAPGNTCTMPGCVAAGQYRAPKSRTSLREWHWFCLDHVRAYNAGWDFYKGMSPGEIEAHLRADTQWQRPSWPLGQLGASQIDPKLDPGIFTDPLGVLGAAGRKAAPRKNPDAAPDQLRKPLAALGLGWPVTLAAVKTRYKQLAKKHHPDANGGDRAAEERLKDINLAYAAVRAHLTPEPIMVGR